MSGYVDHGWRHAPKADGGTDPVPGIGSGGGGIQFDTYNEGSWFALTTLNDGDTTDDGIAFYNQAAGGILFQNTANPGFGIRILDPGGAGIQIKSEGGAEFDANVTISALGTSSDISIEASGSTYVAAYTDVVLIPDSNETDPGYIKFLNLPTSDPGGSNRVWNDGGTLKIT